MLLKPFAHHVLIVVAVGLILQTTLTHAGDAVGFDFDSIGVRYNGTLDHALAAPNGTRRWLQIRLPIA